MNNNNSLDCERAGDLISVLYGEADEHAQREFQLHLQQCETCRTEFGAFEQVREAIGEWRDEALSVFVSSPVVAAPPRKSAVAALRQFFTLSPLWMKGAVGFAAVVFCVLAVLAFGRSPSIHQVAPLAQVKPDAIYTKDDVKRAVDEALANQQALAKKETEQRVATVPKPQSKVTVSEPNNGEVARSTRTPQQRRPFSRSEREQLAAELRLVSSDDNDIELPDQF
jgi:hypothetical protein